MLEQRVTLVQQQQLKSGDERGAREEPPAGSRQHQGLGPGISTPHL